MNIIRCGNGHFYDADTFDQCPHCKIMARRGERHVSLEQVAFLEPEQEEDSVSAGNWDVFPESDHDTGDHSALSGGTGTGMSEGGESSTSKQTQRIKALDMDSFAEFPDDAAGTFGRDMGISPEAGEAYHPFSQRGEESQIEKVMQHFGLLKEDGPVTQKLQPAHDSVEEPETGAGLPYEEFEEEEPGTGQSYGELEEEPGTGQSYGELEEEPGKEETLPPDEGEEGEQEAEKSPAARSLEENGPVTQRYQPFYDGSGEVEAGKVLPYVEFEEKGEESPGSLPMEETEPGKEETLPPDEGEEGEQEAEKSPAARSLEEDGPVTQRFQPFYDGSGEAEAGKVLPYVEFEKKGEESPGSLSQEEAEPGTEVHPREEKTEAFLEKRGTGLSADDEKAGLSCQNPGDLPVGWAVCVKGPMKGEIFTLKNGKNSIGRKNPMDIALPADQSLSEINHAFIEYDSAMKQFFAVAGTSRGLCYVSDRLVLMKVPVRNYERISLGESELMLVQLCGDQFNWDISQE